MGEPKPQGQAAAPQQEAWTPISVPLAEKDKAELIRIVEMMQEDMAWYVAERNRLLEVARKLDRIRAAAAREQHAGEREEALRDAAAIARAFAEEKRAPTDVGDWNAAWGACQVAQRIEKLTGHATPPASARAEREALLLETGNILCDSVAAVIEMYKPIGTGEPPAYGYTHLRKSWQAVAARLAGWRAAARTPEPAPATPGEREP